MSRLVLILLAVAACKRLDLPKPVAHWYLSHKEHRAEAHWTYEGETGPEHWGDLHPNYRAAKDGKLQSPIDIVTAHADRHDLPELEVKYTIGRAKLLNNGHTIQHTGGTKGHVKVGGKFFHLRQFHAHTPSEHTINGKHFPLELHFVHAAEDGEICVIAVLCAIGPEDPKYDNIAKGLPEQPGEERDFDGKALFEGLVPKGFSYWTYEGSFTTPPCTEGVRWIVLRNPGEADPRVVKALRRIEGRNSRPTQPLNHRVVRASR